MRVEFAEWYMGYPRGWAEGMARTNAIRALGNAVVPGAAAAAWEELAYMADN